MINEMIDLSEKVADKRKKDPSLIERMESAAQGQSPRFLLISPINRSSQDLELLDMEIGDAFHATRVPSVALPPPTKSPILFAGPASYNHGFAEKRGVILTFEFDEPLEIIRESIENLAKHPDLRDLPVIALRVDYDRGEARLTPHGKGRDYAGENWVLSRIQKPSHLDENTLVLICSDSRVKPPLTPAGLPMAIQTLGGFVPPYFSEDDESALLNAFFERWLRLDESTRHILIIGHGAFKTEGPPCGAAKASLEPSNVTSGLLRSVIQQIDDEASAFEESQPASPEDRVVALASAIRHNLLSYPAVRRYIENAHDDLIGSLFMNTVTNVLSLE
ncbi:MAG: carbonic anhydrase [Candidatus Thorarchaeota archaeon]|nr:MAG: hypothetical protein DRP09_03565 [Candidatus Thorarchaeota archaeon]RLI59499.1 MAG: hypothetical protein DRO87_02835 [Candidatus Thorarchaeota archaeon]